MIDQSHNMKGKMEAMVQTVVTAQELFLKAALVDRERLAELQSEARTVDAEECLRSAFWTDVRPMLREWRRVSGAFLKIRCRLCAKADMWSGSRKNARLPTGMRLRPTPEPVSVP